MPGHDCHKSRRASESQCFCGSGREPMMYCETERTSDVLWDWENQWCIVRTSDVLWEPVMYCETERTSDVLWDWENQWCIVRHREPVMYCENQWCIVRTSDVLWDTENQWCIVRLREPVMYCETQRTSDVLWEPVMYCENQWCIVRTSDVLWEPVMYCETERTSDVLWVWIVWCAPCPVVPLWSSDALGVLLSCCRAALRVLLSRYRAALKHRGWRVVLASCDVAASQGIGVVVWGILQKKNTSDSFLLHRTIFQYIQVMLRINLVIIAINAINFFRD